jgi:hypothetical protein
MDISRARALIDFIKRHAAQSVLVTFFLAVTAFGIFGSYSEMLYKFRKQEISWTRYFQASSYLKIIRDGSKADWEKAAALEHLAVDDEASAFRLAREWIGLDKPVLVKAGIHVLKLSREGSDQDKLFQMYKQSKDEKYRVYLDDLVESLLAKPLDLPKLYELAYFPTTKDTARIKMFGAILQMETNLEQRKKILDHLLKVAKVAKGDLRVQAILALSAAEPNDAGVVGLNRKVVEDDEPELAPFSIMHLAKVKDAWLMKRYSSLLNSDDSNLQAAAIRAMPVVCPPHGARQLAEIYFATDDMPTRGLALNIAAQFEDEESEAFIKKAFAEKKLSNTDLQSLRDRVAQARAAGRKICSTVDSE